MLETLQMVWNTVKILINPTDLEFIHVLAAGFFSRWVIKGLRWGFGKVKITLNRTTVQAATLPSAYLILLVYTWITGLDFDTTSVEALSQVLAASLASIGFHEATKTKFISDVKETWSKIVEKAIKK